MASCSRVMQSRSILRFHKTEMSSTAPIPGVGKVGKPLEPWRDVNSGMKRTGGSEKGMFANWLPFWERYGCVLFF